MKFNILIVMLLFSCGLHTVHAMDHHKENVKRLGGWLAETDNDEKQEGQPTLATVTLDSPKAKKGSASIDHVSQKIEQSLIEQEKTVEFYTFILNYKKRARAILQDREKTEDTIIREHIKSFSLEQIEKNKNQYADEAQNKIDKYYWEQYSNLYKKMYADHYKVQAPERVVREYARGIYFEQKDSCCVIL